MSPERAAEPSPVDGDALAELALGCLSAERDGTAEWPAGAAVAEWIRAQLAPDSLPGTVATGTGGRFDVVAVSPPDVLLERREPGAGWVLRPIGSAEGTELTDPSVRRWRGAVEPDSPAEPARLPEDAAERLAVVDDIAVAAALVGVADRSLGLAVAHARERTQFGRPIASFQSVAHRLADMYCAVELARSGVLLAAATGTATDARLSRRLAVTTAPDVVISAVHLHGAIGLTGEVAVHTALRRALVLRALPPHPDHVLDALCGDLQDLAERARRTTSIPGDQP
ncbi:acyl-CoA dehydrogenase family protein [Saccharopolyspora sp. NFXS83]|uniref:acyl-CoA dehydrogenase family protein n=1 Tax=Saccharopolyspora sp. NFXS83 TaxID=2993560 RepID=UPI00224B5E88|nr:acyl-CoA dehydrogenase family protein [Saccharopolyspora sp. NFXS83]MCX2730585.1 acyl-CoA dehydrogenase family protein [Saccharopolyspora sp. NFXS83]